jgi:hypothetical protein
MGRGETLESMHYLTNYFVLELMCDALNAPMNCVCVAGESGKVVESWNWLEMARSDVSTSCRPWAMSMQPMRVTGLCVCRDASCTACRSAAGAVNASTPQLLLFLVRQAGTEPDDDSITGVRVPALQRQQGESLDDLTDSAKAMRSVGDVVILFADLTNRFKLDPHK